MSNIHCLRYLSTLVILAAVAVFESAAQAAPATGEAKVPFRINMRLGYGPHAPKYPPPPAGSNQWNDVAEWQRFLKEDGILKGAAYPNDEFDSVTEHATKIFQASYHLPASGVVNWATYCKAFGKGKHPHAVPPQRTRFESRGSCHIRFPMFIGCRDNPHYRDVSTWQTFLVEMGYLGAGYPNGGFDSATRTATARMQADFGLKPNGVVEMKTIHAAEHYEHFSCTPVHLPCPHGRE